MNNVIISIFDQVLFDNYIQIQVFVVKCQAKDDILSITKHGSELTKWRKVLLSNSKSLIVGLFSQACQNHTCE